MEPRVAVITAATGKNLSHLAQAIASVKAQTYPHIQHWIVVDGHEYEEDVRDVMLDSQTLLVLPHNTGGKAAGNYVCHRIYAALPWLVNTDYVAFLDEDNAYTPDHIQKLVHAIRGRQWAHSLRAIMSPDGHLLGVDACESLGGICHSVLSDTDFHVDTNCYLLDTHLARKLAPCWDVPARPPTGRLEADRAVCQTLLGSKLFPGISRTHSLLYRVSGRSDSVTAAFFEKGNDITRFDAAKPDIYLLHFTAAATRTFLNTALPKSPLDEWAMTLWTGLFDSHNVLDGFANAAIIPPGATVLVTLWVPAALPLHVLERTDLQRIGFLLESPNIRHAPQFARDFLTAHFDVVLTYWKPLLGQLGPARSRWCPMNTHCLDLDRPDHRALGLRANRGRGKSVAIVLEHRPHLHGTYDINGVTLRCLDPLRPLYVKGLREITCFGKGWDAVVPSSNIGHTLDRTKDPRTSVDILQEFVFALIIENCDAEGYVSEKVYDCLMAGCIPLYYGDIPGGLGVDIRPFQNGYELQTYLDSLSDAAVLDMRCDVISARETILRRVGTQTYTDIVARCLTDI